MNRQKYMIIYYDLEQMQALIKFIKNKFDDGFSTYECKWAYCLHDKDVGLNGLKKPHYHLMLDFVVKRDSLELFNVLKDYLPNHLHEDLNKADIGGWSYLIHANAPKKAQYDFEDIVHSDNLSVDDLYDLVESHRRKNVESSNAERVTQLFNFVSDNMNGYVSSFKHLVLVLVSKQENELLGWVSKNSYLVNQLFYSDYMYFNSEFNKK